MADLRIDVAAEFKGKKAFTEAQKSTGALDKAVGKLGKQIAGVFAASKIIAFGKASVKAFIEDEKSATKLATAVKNLGLAYEQPSIDHYVKKLEASSSVADDQLRPALQALLTTTGSLTASQNLLSMAIDVSRGSGVELSTVAQDLANAYVGNTRGLRKYNLGLSQAALKTMKFYDVQAKLTKQFSGANAAYLETYAGKLSVLQVAADNAKETIGKGLVDALVLAGGKDGDIQDVADAMASLSTYTADAVRGVGVLVGKLNILDKKFSNGFIGKLLSANFRYGLIGTLAELGSETKPRPRANRPTTGRGMGTLYDADAAKAKKAADAQVKATKALTAEQKKQVALKKAGTVFDMEQIQLIAALKGKLSAEERTRVEAQLALLNDNDVLAQQLTKQILMAQDATGGLYKYFLTIGDAKIKNPFAFLDEWLAQFQAKLAGLTASMGSAAPIGTAAQAAASGRTVTNSTIPSTNVGTPFGQAGSFVDSMGTPFGQAGSAAAPVINVTVQGNIIREQELINQVISGAQLSSLSGSPSQIGRIAGMFG